jgi:hypothetical protein
LRLARRPAAQANPRGLDLGQQPLTIGHMLAREELPQMGRDPGRGGGNCVWIRLTRRQAEQAVGRNRALVAGNIEPRLIGIES